MSMTELQALLPLMVLAGAGTVLLLLAAFIRRTGLVAAVAGLSLLAFLATLVPLWSAGATTPGDLLVVDSLTLFFWALLGLATLAVVVFSSAYFPGRGEQAEQIYGLLLLATSGACVLAASQHFVALFLGLELLSLPLFIMVAWFCRRAEPVEAGVKYLVLSGMATGFLLFGMALIYAGTGLLEFVVPRDPHPFDVGDVYWLAGMALLVTGLVFKLSVVPLHFWTPDVYQGASLPVTAFLATVSKGAVLAVLLRLYVDMGIQQGTGLWTGLAVLAGASMLVGNWLALRQEQLKRLLAYSSIAHMGYALAALLAGGAMAVEAVGFYLAFYLATTLGAFGVLVVLSPAQRDCDRLHALQGLYYRRPALALVMTLMLFSLAGVPLTGGFIGKFYVITTGAGAGLWTLMALVVAGSAIGLYYYLRVVLALFARPVVEPARGPVPLAGVCLAALALALLWLGLYPGPLAGWLETVAAGIVQH